MTISGGESFEVQNSRQKNPSSDPEKSRLESDVEFVEKPGTKSSWRLLQGEQQRRRGQEFRERCGDEREWTDFRVKLRFIFAPCSSSHFQLFQLI